MTATDSALPVASHFADAPQQRNAATLGMWVFLATEIIFFGVLFFAYTIGRLLHPEAFAAAGRHTNLVLGTANTAVLLTSSLTMALAVRAAGLRAAKAAAWLLAATASLGIVFVGIKLTEYGLDWREHLVPVLNFAYEGVDARGAELFFWLYFATTGAHLAHLVVGIGIACVFAWRAARWAHARLPVRIEIAGLYWHFVDIVWIFLYPCLYLIARS